MTSKYSTLHFQGTPLQVYVDKKGMRWWHLGELTMLLGFKEEEALSIARGNGGYYDTPTIDSCVSFPHSIGGAVATSEEGAFKLAMESKAGNAESFYTWLCKLTYLCPSVPPLVEAPCKNPPARKVPPLIEELCKVLGTRELEYGPADILFGEIAERWSAVLKHPITSKQVALCMIDLKMARLSRNLTHKDSLLDLIGYALCYVRIQGWD